MFETDEDRGQVGIGTLIVFIAMVLVAAIAAGVLINTAGFLQTKSEQTGQQSASQVTNQLQVNAKTGTVGQSTARYLTFTTKDHPTVKEGDAFDVAVTDNGGGTLNLSDGTDSVTLADGDQVYFVRGSDGTAYLSTNDTAETADVNLSSAFLNDTAHSANVSSPPSFQVTFSSGGADTKTYDVYGDSAITTPIPSDEYRIDTKAVVDQIELTVMRGAGSDDVNLEQATVQVIGPDGSPALTYGGNGQSSVETDQTFGLEPVKDVGGTLPVMSSSEDRFKMLIDVGELETGDDVTLKVSTESGATKEVQLTVPDSLVDKKAVRL